MSVPMFSAAQPDRRAERVRAAAEAEQARAAAEATRAQTAARMWDLQSRQAERLAELAAQARRRRQVERVAAAERRRASVAATGAAAARGLPVVAGVIACLAPTLIATRGQYEFGVTTMGLGGMAVLVPLMLEGAAWLLAWRRHQAVTADEPAGRLTVGMWTLALTAAGLNLWHGAATESMQVGTIYGVASLIGFGLVELLTGHRRHVHRHAQRRAAGIDPTRARRIALWRGVRFPRLAWAAWSRRIEIGVSLAPDADPAAEVAEAWRQAWLDRFGVEPGTPAAARLSSRRQVRLQRRDLVEPGAMLATFRAPELGAAPEDGFVLTFSDGPTPDADRTGAAEDRSSDAEDRPRTGKDRDQARPDVRDLLDAGREVAELIDAEGLRLTRAALAAGLREQGHAASTDRVTELLSVLRGERTAVAWQVPGQAADQAGPGADHDTARRWS